MSEERTRSLQVLHDIGGYSAVFKPGSYPNIIIKSASSQPQVYDFAEPNVKSLAPLHTAKCHRGMVYTDGEVRKKKPKSYITLLIEPLLTNAY